MLITLNGIGSGGGAGNRAAVRPVRMRQTVATGLVFAVVFVVPACGGDDQRAGRQPAPDVTSLEQGRFDELPLLPDSEPFGPRTEKDGIVARTYRAAGVTPEAVVAFYERELPSAGWRPAEPAFRADTESRSDWVTDEWRLEVSSTRIEDRRAASADQVVVQYSLVLRPRRR